MQRFNSRRRTAPALRPADLLIPAWSDGRPLAIDLTISHPCQNAELPYTGSKGTSFLKRKETIKLDKYSSPCQEEGWGFLPLALSTWGEVGPTSKPLWQRLRRRVAQGLDCEARSFTMHSLDQHISTLLAMQAATCIVNTNNHFLLY